MRSPEMELGQAIKVLVHELNTDADYRRSWSANIAMAFKDEWMIKLEHNSDIIEFEDLHLLANDAAERFLRNLAR